MRLAETLIRECLNIADMADEGHIPWDAGVRRSGCSGPGGAGAADYLRGYMNVAMRSMGGARPVTAPNGLAAAGDRAVSDRDLAFEAHGQMRRSIGDALRGAVSAPAAAPAWGASSSFGGAAVSDRDAADDAHAADAALDLRRVAEPMSAPDLDSRIAGLLQRSRPAPDDVAALLAEVEAALAKVGEELARRTREALDPTSTTAVIASARGVMFERRIPAAAFGGGAGSARREACGGARAC